MVPVRLATLQNRCRSSNEYYKASLGSSRSSTGTIEHLLRRGVTGLPLDNPSLDMLARPYNRPIQSNYGIETATGQTLHARNV
jgi:hypothetical protein